MLVLAMVLCFFNFCAILTIFWVLVGYADLGVGYVFIFHYWN